MTQIYMKENIQKNNCLSNLLKNKKIWNRVHCQRSGEKKKKKKTKTKKQEVKKNSLTGRLDKVREFSRESSFSKRAMCITKINNQFTYLSPAGCMDPSGRKRTPFPVSRCPFPSASIQASNLWKLNKLIGFFFVCVVHSFE